MDPTTITRNGKRFVLVPIKEYRRLAEVKLASEASEGPALPAADRKGNRNAIDFARAAIARRLIADRRAAGLSQQDLAKLAGVRQETISRLESGKHTATVRVIDKLDRAIRKATSRRPAAAIPNHPVPARRRSA